MAEKETLRDIESVYPLSPMQDGMLFHSLYAQDSAVYVEQLVCTLSGRLDPAIFQESWEMVVRHHPILRTSFAWKNAERMHQVVHKRVTLPFVFEDWSGWAEAEKQRRFDVVKAADHRTGFVLDKAPLMRLGLYRWGELSWRFIWTHHHLLLDGWSLPLVLKEFCATYQSLERGTEPSINPCRPFKEYISWCSRQNLSSAEGFWRKTLGGVSAPTRLAVNRVSLEIAGDHGEQCKESVFLSQEETRVIQEFCKREHCTTNTLIQGAYALLLSRYCGEEDVVYGITTSGRPDVFPDAENMIGLFINTLPLRVHVSAQTPLRELLRRIQNDVVEMRQYEYSPLAKVQGWSNVPRGVPLFHSIFVFENYPLDSSLLDDLGAVKVTDVEAAGGTNYPLTLVAAVRGRLSLEIVYGEVFFAPESIKRMLGHLHRLLSEIVNCPENTAGNLTIVTTEERDNLVKRWNDTDVSFPDADIPVHAMFERCVASAADSTALQYQGQTMSYGELNRRANNVAHFLHELGVRRESLVGLCCERSFDMIVGLMGIVKAGAGYVPLDPEYPRERLAFMLADAEVKYLVTHRSLERLLPRECDVIVRLDGDWETIQHAGDENPPISVLPENVAYVIYTSGSTGRPKGVLVAHRGLSNFVCAQRSWLGIDGSARILQFASLGFDASASEIFATLTSGGRLQLVSPELVRSPEELSEFLISERTSFITLPPTFLALLKEKDFPDLRCVISAGEACPVELAPRWSRGRRFVNAYGPTETTIGATWNSEEGSSSGGSTVPIGRPMPNIKVYLLDRFLHPVPVGVEGELYIAGIGVSRGYLGRPDLTAEKFIPDMLGTSPGARLYRTGDLGRFLPDGTILFSGRTDRQVKIRGLRVEPGEIEAHLRAHGWVKEAVVDVRPDRLGERQLVAYIIPENTERINIREIREFLSKRLPSSLVPAAFVLRESFPLSPSGKVDLRALPDPGDSDLVGTGVRVPPRTGTEELLAGIWADILGVEGVGREDNFFELGGHSLRVTQLLSRVRQVFSVELPLRAVFETPSLQGLAGEVDKQRNGDGFVVLLPALEAVPRTEEIPLSFSQQRLWFLEQLEPGSPTYNIPASFNVSGPLRLDILRQCVEEMISRHEILRTRFVKRHGQPYQHVEDGMDPPFSDVDLSVLTPEEQQEHIFRTALDESRQCFNLETGPLFRISVLTRGADDHVILLTMHHIIADGWSIGVMIREMSTLYEAFAAGRPSDLQPPQVQYADFAAWQRTWLSGDIFEMQLSYWKHQLEGMPTFLELPLDRSRPSMQSSEGQTESLEISSDLRVALEELCQQVGVTMYMLLLTAFGVLLHRYSRQDDFAVGSPIANRRHSQTEDLIGFFVNTLVLRMRFSDSMTVRDLLKSTREMCLDAFAHQDLPFEKIVEALQPARDMGRSPLFQTAFVHQNFPTQSLQISGLTITPFNIEIGTNKFDLTLTTAEMPDGVRADLEYSTALFDQSTAARMLRHFSTILEQFVTDVDQPVGRVPLLKKAELQELLVKRNNSYADFPDNQCVHEWFEAEVERHPNEIALSRDSSEISYRDLNSRANQLARYLRSLGVGPETLVGLCFDRSSEMIIAILGVLKAGGAFVPLDPAYPAERLSHMVRDSKITVVLSHTLVVDRLPENGYRTVLLDREWEVIGKANAENLRLNSSPDGLAYIIYTSGST
ncbi:MAG: amino acid adenylation domain-containing protein, partial [Bacteroidota bacterium]